MAMEDAEVTNDSVNTNDTTKMPTEALPQRESRRGRSAKSKANGSHENGTAAQHATTKKEETSSGDEGKGREGGKDRSGRGDDDDVSPREETQGAGVVHAHSDAKDTIAMQSKRKSRGEKRKEAQAKKKERNDQSKPEAEAVSSAASVSQQQQSSRGAEDANASKMKNKKRGDAKKAQVDGIAASMAPAPEASSETHHNQKPAAKTTTTTSAESADAAERAAPKTKSKAKKSRVSRKPDGDKVEASSAVGADATPSNSKNDDDGAESKGNGNASGRSDEADTTTAPAVEGEGRQRRRRRGGKGGKASQDGANTNEISHADKANSGAKEVQESRHAPRDGANAGASNAADQANAVPAAAASKAHSQRTGGKNGNAAKKALHQSQEEVVQQTPASHRREQQQQSGKALGRAGKGGNEAGGRAQPKNAQSNSTSVNGNGEAGTGVRTRPGSNTPARSQNNGAVKQRQTRSGAPAPSIGVSNGHGELPQRGGNGQTKQHQQQQQHTSLPYHQKQPYSAVGGMSGPTFAMNTFYDTSDTTRFDSGNFYHPFRPRDVLKIPYELASMDSMIKVHKELAETVSMQTGCTVVLSDDNTAFEISAMDMDNVSRAKLLIDHSIGLELSSYRRTAAKEQLVNDVKRMRSEMESGLRVEFSVDKSFISQVIGLRGANVRRVQSQSGVDRIVVDKDYGIIRIVGSRKEDVEMARQELEYVKLELKVPRESVGYVIGKEGRNIKEIISKSGAMSINFSKDKSKMMVFGKRKDAEVAVSLVEFQLRQLKNMEAAEAEMEELQRELEELSLNWGEDSFLLRRGGDGDYWSRQHQQRRSTRASHTRE